MSAQCPLLWVPLKATQDVSYAATLRSTISSVYQESPDSYKEEISTLDRCRQDALRGSAGSDVTGRDLLYKYFGQLELLELRFPEVRVPFPWKDAFTGKEISQLSLAYEKASVIFNIAATLSSLAAQQNRTSSEGIKRAFHNFRCAAGMFTYINDNFLHAPSTDMSREVVKVLVQLMVAQATEVFVEKLTEERKAPALRARVATQAAFLYGSIAEDVRELVAKGIFERSWTWLVQSKQKYFTAIAQHQRALADQAASKYGDALTRLIIAENAAKDASRFAASFSAAFHGMLGTTHSNTLPSDAGTSLLDLTKAQVTICNEAKMSAQRDNDLIYHAAQPSEASLPSIEKSSVADPIPIQEVYGTPEVQKVVGQDIFIRLVPLSVHESASLYSEEKAKLVRTEGDRCEMADSELAAGLEHLGLPSSLDKYRDVTGPGTSSRLDALTEPPAVVRDWSEEVKRSAPPTVGELFCQLSELRDSASQDIERLLSELDGEFKECESLRVKYGHMWEQAPSAGLTKVWRGELKARRSDIEAATAPDRQTVDMWRSVQDDVTILEDPTGEALDRLFAEAIVSDAPKGAANSASLLDLESGADEDEAAEIGRRIKEIEEGTARLNTIKKERSDVFRDLKERIQSDDISQLLILNRKSTNIEPALFAAELEKFRPHSGRIAATVHHQTVTLSEVTASFKALTEGKKAREIQERWAKATKRRRDLQSRLQKAQEGYSQVRAGLGKGIEFYGEIAASVDGVRRRVTGFINSRKAERTEMVSRAEMRQRLDGGEGRPTSATPSPASAVTPAPAIQTLERQVRAMDLGSPQSPGGTRSPAVPPPLPPPPKEVRPSWQQQQPMSNPLPAPPSAASTPSYQTPAGSSEPSYAPSKPQYQPSYAPALTEPSSHGRPPPPKPQHQPSYPPPPPAKRYVSQPPPQHYSSPHPAQPPADPYAGLGSFGFGASGPAPPPPASTATQYSASALAAASPVPHQQPQIYQDHAIASLPPAPAPVDYRSGVPPALPPSRPMSGYSNPTPASGPYQPFPPPPPPQTVYEQQQQGWPAQPAYPPPGAAPNYGGPLPPLPQAQQQPSQYAYGQAPQQPQPPQNGYAGQQPYYGGAPPQQPGGYRPQPQYGQPPPTQYGQPMPYSQVPRPGY